MKFGQAPLLNLQVCMRNEGINQRNLNCLGHVWQILWPSQKIWFLGSFLPGYARQAWCKKRPRSPPIKFLISFLSEVMEAKWGWWNKNWMFYIKSQNLRIPKIIGFWLQCHWIMKKCSSEMHQFESADPVNYFSLSHGESYSVGVLWFFAHVVSIKKDWFYFFLKTIQAGENSNVTHFFQASFIDRVWSNKLCFWYQLFHAEIWYQSFRIIVCVLKRNICKIRHNYVKNDLPII